MTRTHAARQLLAHGGLSFAQFAEITGWPMAVCRRVLSYLVDDTGEASRLGRIYRMTNGKELSYVQELATQSKPSNGQASASDMRTRAAMDVLPTAAPVRETQAGCARCGRCTRGVGG